MFSRNVLFLQLAFLQTAFSSVNDNLQVVSTTQGPSKPYEKSNRLNLEIDFDKLIAGKLETLLQNQFKHQNEVANEMKSQIGELKREILLLKDESQTQLQKLEQKQEEHLIVLKEQLAVYKNVSENQLQKIEQKQKLFEQLLIDLENLKPPKDCKDLQNRGKTLSGVYTIWPKYAPKSFDVWCDMDTRGGGWLYVINRFNGSVDFNLNWTDYKNGFGDFNGELWLGLEHLYLLTVNKTNELLIELVDKNSTTAYAHYKQFSIGSENEKYAIKIIKDYSGDAGDDFGRHLGWNFTTADRDHDTHSEQNCAVTFGGGFWYNACLYCLFTGSYNTPYGIQSLTFRGYNTGLKRVKMMIRS